MTRRADIQERLLESIAEELASEPPVGEVPDYIPQLSTVDPERFGIALQKVEGELLSAGDATERFSVQSIAKVFTLARAMTLEPEAMWRRVSVEPSGSAFNSLVQLEYERGVPRNPLLNAGALVVCDILVERLERPKDDFLAFVRSVSGMRDLVFDEAVAASELRTAHLNRALLNLMRSFGNIRCDLAEVLDFYVHICSLAMSCQELARAFAFLADHGRSLPRGEHFLTRRQVRRINAIMLTCGFYDESGDFAFRVGLPGKSGVGGGIVAVCPGEFAAAAWSPRLGPKGNSVLGTRALELLVQRTDSSIF
jgi:glutaminase